MLLKNNFAGVYFYSSYLAVSIYLKYLVAIISSLLRTRGNTISSVTLSVGNPHVIPYLPKCNDSGEPLSCGNKTQLKGIFSRISFCLGDKNPLIIWTETNAIDQGHKNAFYTLAWRPAPCTWYVSFFYRYLFTRKIINNWKDFRGCEELTHGHKS